MKGVLFIMLIVLIEFLIFLPILIPMFIRDKIEAKKRGLHIYGIECFHGLAGYGKTISMTKELNRLREKYGDSVYITTNYAYEKEDFPFKSWTQLLENYDKPLIVAWDELVNLFCSREFKNFPIQLLGILTQVRKDNGIKLMFATQQWHMIDKNFRSLCHYVHDCRTWLGLFTFVRYYRTRDFEERFNTYDTKKKYKIKPLRTYSFIQTKKLRNSYDSYKMIESAKNMQYMSREEIAAIEKNTV